MCGYRFVVMELMSFLGCLGIERSDEGGAPNDN